MSERSYPIEGGVNLRRLANRSTTAEPDTALPADEVDHFEPTAADLAEARPSLPELSQLRPSTEDAATDPARWGFRGWANAATGGLLKLKPKTPEVTARAAVAAVRQQWVGHQRIVVANPKGGEGCTIAALMLGNIFAHERGGGTVIWDANEAEGTLAARVSPGRHNATVWDLLEHADDLTNPATERAAFHSFVRLQPSRAEVLAADEDPHGTALISAEHCRVIDAVLRRYRELVVIDTGNNRRRSNWLWCVYNAHLLVIPMTLREDSAVAVVRMLSDLHDRLHLYSLISNAIVVLTVPPTGVTAEVRSRIQTALQRCGIRNMAEVPFDPVLAGGGLVDHARLSEDTVAAWTQVAAMAATSLAASSELHQHGVTDGGRATHTDDVDEPAAARESSAAVHPIDSRSLRFGA
ncbi:Flp pilus assembly protein, ATPase CpaE [Nocardia otitidiscaviarum]|uniref:Flp pilus assembly protein, ATPase CpaE n=1 Tax=Nocardia otitidiscaviarum TaxID=1823 RepID=A0A379JM52_9NOCA|nr:hypothetical protein [Nocardia otitidiscaviarum]SUD49578.1 Flp pilus assembly protein, ATPase CpaE [Nocardia otitidiscaviarum]